ncbi:MAG: peptidase [Cellvibrionales bacterium TMED49]|nr:MAG: peptidase [Cellvibrionales bacterium TMED49]
MLFSSGLILTSCLYLYLSPKLPSVEELSEIELQIPLRVYSHDLKVIAEFGEKKRSPVSFEEIPNTMVNAFLAAEDSSFFEHGGIAISGLARAALELARTGSIRSGGSTITMQVARNFFLTRKQEFTRKFNEIILAIKIEKEFSKKEILSLYTNKIYMGNRAYGVGAAAQVYYGKSLNQLSLAETAMIAGLPKAPSKYNPLANPQRALLRRDWILGRMLALGNIDQVEYQNAISELDEASYHGSLSQLEADYAAEVVRQKVIERFGREAYTKGYSVITTIDSDMQENAVEAVQSGILTYDKRHGYRGPEKRAVEATEWLSTLRSTPIFGKLHPMIVVETNDDFCVVLDAENQLHTISWKDSLQHIRKYKTVNETSDPIKSPNEVFAPGDLIRLIKTKDQAWELTQLPRAQAAFIALIPNNGAITAMVGGFDYKHSNFNRVTQATRQPGSNFKPFIYASALKNGFTAATLINDAPVVFNDEKLEKTWRPENDGGKFFGPTRLREALYRSRNLVSIRLLRRLGIDRALEGLQGFGFQTGDMPLDLSLALGSHALTPLEIVSGYAVFANGGYRVTPHIIGKVIDRDGNIIFATEPSAACPKCLKGLNITPDTEVSELLNVDLALENLFTELSKRQKLQSDRVNKQMLQLALKRPIDLTTSQAPQVLDPQTAFIIDSILKDVIQRGTGRKAKILDREDLGGKTGTTNGPRDAWFSGYSPTIVATAWLGFDDNSIIGKNEYGGSAALPIWIEFMADSLKDTEQIQKLQPGGLVRVKIDEETGKRIGANQEGIYEYFKSDKVPELLLGTGRLPLDQQNPIPEDLF